jgi:hypothetical protein
MLHTPICIGSTQMLVYQHYKENIYLYSENMLQQICCSKEAKERRTHKILYQLAELQFAEVNLSITKTYLLKLTSVSSFNLYLFLKRTGRRSARYIKKRGAQEARVKIQRHSTKA